MKYFLMFIVILSVCGCGKEDFYTNEKSDNEEVLVNEIMHKVAIKLNRDRGLIPFGTGAQMMHKIEMLALAFQYRKPIEIEEGRELLITAVNEFVAAVNAEERIRPYLANYPFDPKNIEIRIFVQRPDGSQAAPGKLRLLKALEGELEYEITDPSTGGLETILEETYQEAEQKIAALSSKASEEIHSPQISYVDEIISHILGEEQDPSIEFIPAESSQNPFSLLVFNDIPEKPPYRVETRRLLQDNFEIYIPAEEAQAVLNNLNGVKVPFAVMMLPQEYLPGEIVSWRICSSNGKILKEATCCPQPKVLKNASGELILEAALLSVCHPDTVYMLLFPPAKENIEYIFTAGTKQSKGVIPAGQLTYTTFAPEIKDLSGGIGTIEIQLEGKSYKLDLAWGTKLMAFLEKREP